MDNLTRLGIDIGGTFIKFAVLKNGEILYKDQIPTNQESDIKLLGEITEKAKEIIKDYSIERIGVGVPGRIENGTVLSGNLPFKYTPVEKILKDAFSPIPVTVQNDANCAALGEALFGAGEKCENVVLVTLGTGIGGGIILERKIAPGNKCMGEIGHMIVMAKGGRECPCGLSGCWEQYASVTALIRQATETALLNKQDLLYKKYTENGEKLDGKLIFDAFDEGSACAVKVISDYIDWLKVGIESLVKIFAPDSIILAGGITKQGDKLLGELNKRANIRETKIEISHLQNDAGSLGAAML